MISYSPLFRTMKTMHISSYRLIKMGFPASNYYAMKKGNWVSTATINHLCRLLQCRVEEVMEYVDDDMNAAEGKGCGESNPVQN